MSNPNGVRIRGQHQMRLWRGCVAALLASVGCSTTTAVSTVEKVAVTPTGANLTVHNQVTLHAVLTGAGGQVLNGPFVYWSSGDTAIAAVSSSGVVTGMAPGHVQIAASADGISGTATIAVSAVPVASVTIVPATLTVRVGSTGQLLATAYDGSGHVVSGLTATWGSSNPAAATVNQSGKVTGVASGTSTVSASIGGKTGSAVVVVPTQVATVGITPDTLRIAPGATGQLTATARDSSGKVVTGLTTAWSSSRTSVATVDGSGKITGKAFGLAVISATIQAQTGTATVIVFALPPPTVKIAGCSGGTITETDAAPIIVTGDIDNQCRVTLTSTAGSIEVQGKVDHGSVVNLAATAGVAIDHEIAGGSTVNVSATGAFTVGSGIGGGHGAVALTVSNSDTLVVQGDISDGTQAKLHSHGPIAIMGQVHDHGTMVVWWAPSFVAIGGVNPPGEAVKQNWGGFPDRY